MSNFVQNFLPIDAYLPNYDKSDFFISECNAEAYRMICDVETDLWPQRKLMLIGESGSGKTHIAKMWMEQGGNRKLLDFSKKHKSTKHNFESESQIDGDIRRNHSAQRDANLADLQDANRFDLISEISDSFYSDVIVDRDFAANENTSSDDNYDEWCEIIGHDAESIKKSVLQSVSGSVDYRMIKRKDASIFYDYSARKPNKAMHQDRRDRSDVQEESEDMMQRDAFSDFADVSDAWSDDDSHIMSSSIVSGDIMQFIASSDGIVCDISSGIEQQILFDIINFADEWEIPLLILARTLNNISLRDLLSRIVSMYMIRIGRPSEEMIRVLVYKYLADMQISLKKSMIDYIVMRTVDKGFAALSEIIAGLRQEIMRDKNIDMKNLMSIISGV